MLSKGSLQVKSCTELREIAKSLNIPGRWNMTKEVLISAIIHYQISAILAYQSEENTSDEQKEFQYNVEDRMNYVEKADVGTIVAFRLNNGKVKSAKITRKSSKQKLLEVETVYGAVYKIKYEDVIWVRTGKTWPKGVYRLLTGQANEKTSS